MHVELRHVAHVEMAAGEHHLATERAMVFRTSGGRITAIRDAQDDQFHLDEFWSAVAVRADGGEPQRT